MLSECSFEGSRVESRSLANGFQEAQGAGVVEKGLGCVGALRTDCTRGLNEMDLYIVARTVN